MTTILSVSFSLSIESFGFFREALLEGCVTNFTLQEFLEFAIIRFFGIEAERVLALFFEFRIVAEEIPVTAFDSEFFFCLALAHALTDTMVDARSVADNQGRAMVSFSFGDSFEELVLVSAHSYLSYVNIAVGNSHHAEVLLLGAFAGSSELCDSCSRGSFRGLTAGVGVNFRIEDEDVDVVVRSEDMVNTAVTDIVGPTVTTDDPLAAFY